MKSAFILTIYFFQFHAFASNYAVVIGGASRQDEPEQHEFARNVIAVSKGLIDHKYQTQTLFGPEQKLHTERTKYKADYEQLDKIQNDQKPVTSESINKYFEDLKKKVRTGDKVEIFVIAHGHDTCGDVGKHIRKDFNSGCHHTFTIYDDSGKPVQFSSDKLFEHIKDLEDKGAVPNIVLSSCNSGRAKGMLKKYGLKKTCAFFQTAGNAVGYGCFESDPEFSTDYNSVSEFMALRYFHQLTTELEKDPYFSDSTCFQKVLKHAKDNKLDLSNIASTYWASRNSDSTFQEPTISSLLKIPYFRGESLSFVMREQQILQCRQIQNKFQSLLSKLDKTLDETIKLILHEKLAMFYAAFESYNMSLHEQKSIIEKYENSTESGKKLLEQEISDAQSKTRLSAKKFQLTERELLDQFGNIYKTKDNSCERSL